MAPNMTENDLDQMTHQEMCLWLGDLFTHYFFAPIKAVEPMYTARFPAAMHETQLQWTQYTFITLITKGTAHLGHQHTAFLTVSARVVPDTEIHLTNTQETFLWINDIVAKIA